MARAAKIKVIIALGLLAAGLLSYLMAGRPVYRPLFLFTALAVSTGALADIIIREPRQYTLPAAALGILNGFVLRISAYIPVPSVGLDHGRWLARTEIIHEIGHVTGGDMYAASPLYLIELSVLQSILGLSGPEVRYVTILSASLLPGLIGITAYYLTGRSRVGGLAVLFSAFFPLFLRTSTLLESEYMAMAWLVTAQFLFIHGYRNHDRRIQALLIAVLSTSVILHFFYSLMIWGTITGAFVFATILTTHIERVEFESPASPQLLEGACLISALVILSWQLWSTYVHASVMTALSFLTIDFSSFLSPSSGSSLSDTTAGGGTNSLRLIGKYAGLAIPLLIGGVGGFLSVWQSRKRDSPGIFIALAVGTATAILLVAGLDYNLGFRMFYAVGSVATIFAAVGILRLSSIPQLPLSPMRTVLTLLIVMYAFTAPLSGLGNNTDPRFGGTSWALSQSEYEQLTAADATLSDNHEPTNSLKQIHPYFLPETPPNARITSSDCGGNATILTTGNYHICTT